jgi:hypothetical protein
MSVINNHKSVFTNFFTAVEGFHAVADMHSCYSGITSYGLVEILFTPNDLVRPIVMPMITSANNDLWIMEKSGALVFDQDTSAIGDNLLTDPKFAAFPTLVAAAQLMAAGESGETSYSYYITGTSTLVNKKAWWKTIHLHNNAWKIVYTQQQ